MRFESSETFTINDVYTNLDYNYTTSIDKNQIMLGLQIKNNHL